MADSATQDRRAGQLLIASAMVALVLANSPVAHGWHDLIHARVGPIFDGFGQMSLHGAIADGAMALFFLLVGLEVKREWIEGRLAKREARRLPILAAVAGMAVPAAVYKKPGFSVTSSSSAIGKASRPAR